MGKLTISRVAREAGVHVETVRYYERLGLIPRPLQPATGYRIYPPEAVRRIRFIKRAQGLGFSLREIGTLLSFRATPRSRCSLVKRRAEGKISEIEAKIRSLRSMRTALGRLVRQCSGEVEVTDCPVLDALEDAGTTEQRPSNRNRRSPHVRRR